MTRTSFALAFLMGVQPCFSGIVTLSSSATIASGDMYDGVDVIDTPPERTTVDVLGGSIVSLRVFDAAVASVHGGNLLSLTAQDSGTIDVFGVDDGWVIGATDSAQINLYGNAARQSVFADGTSSLSLYPGSVALVVTVQGSASGEMYGGSVLDLQTTESGTLRLRGGQIANCLIATDDSRVEILGRDFSYDPMGGTRGEGLIQGSWLDGSPLSISLAAGPDDTYSHITFVPEPASLILVAIGALPRLRRRRSVV